LAELDANGRATQADSGITIERANYEVDGRRVEAISILPPGSGRLPGLLLIPGHSMTARDWLGNGLAFAAAGYACLAVTQPGYGGSEGPPDFVGPKTIAALKAGWARLRHMERVDSARLGLVGYSRGALAAALLATQLEDVRAAVLGAGIYDFQSAYDAAAPLIRQNMEAETGMTPEAIAQRSPVLQLEQLSGALLILHGDSDANAPVEQAYLLRDRLTELGKDFEIQVFTGAEHSIGIANFRKYSLDFLDRKLSR